MIRFFSVVSDNIVKVALLLIEPEGENSLMVTIVVIHRVPMKIKKKRKKVLIETWMKDPLKYLNS